MKKSNTYIIAEIGINHNGSMKIAKRLILDAKEAGASAAKFQVFETETLGRPKMKKNLDQIKNSKKNISLSKMWKRVYLDTNKLKILKNFCKKNKIDFICSVFDDKSLNKVLKIGVDYLKIASSDINDIVLLKKIKKTKKKVILSTGMATYKEIVTARKILGNKIVILHCVSLYPCSIDNANLKRIVSLKSKFNNKIGYSDHTIGNGACKIAITLGASVIEKHFTFNKKLIGADHNISANKEDLKEIVSFAKNYSKFLGSGKINPTKLEMKNKKFFRKGIYFSKDINKNTKINLDHISFLRPANKIKLNDYKKFIGKNLKRNVIKFQKVEMKLFSN